MRNPSHNVTSLRAEARLLTTAGLILIAIGFPITLTLVLMAMSPEGISPIVPVAAGGPPLLLGYLACHYASERLARAKALEAHGQDAGSAFEGQVMPHTSSVRT